MPDLNDDDIDIESTAEPLSQGADAIKKGVDQAADEGQDLLNRLVSGAHAVIDKLAQAATPTVDKLKDTFTNPTGKLSDKKDEWVGTARDLVRENPLAAVAGALAVGMLYVKLTSTSRRSPRDGHTDLYRD